MKRRKILQLLGLAPLAASCKEKFPSTPTIVTGKIVDENGLPLEGAGLDMAGIKWKGFTPIPTSGVITMSDKNGIYALSLIVPDGTAQLSVLPYSTNKVPIGNQGYAHYIFLDGHYKQLGTPHDIPLSDWGKITTLNYQFIPR